MRWCLHPSRGILQGRRTTMAEVDYTQLQQHYGGQYIARRAGEILASAETYDALSDLVEALPEGGEDLVIEYVEPVGSVRVY
jgi:Family of unknown function (DUF5678)